MPQLTTEPYRHTYWLELLILFIPLLINFEYKKKALSEQHGLFYLIIYTEVNPSSCKGYEGGFNGQ